MQVTFLGGAGTVTGSKFLVSTRRARVLVDCGLFQGLKQLRLRNWRPLPFDATKLDAVVLTHAHIDHSGYLPALFRQGFRGPVHCTPPTKDLVEILLPDSGHLQEEDARYANKERFSKHKPALPLYTEEDARRVLPHLQPAAFDRPVEIGDLRISFRPAGHILGAASVAIASAGRSLLISGDLGRPNDLLMQPPEPPCEADWILMESTYGNRSHANVDLIEVLGDIARRTNERNGILLVPAFAVGRAQLVLYCLHRAFASGALPRVPVYLNSPMAIDVTELYQRHADYHRLSSEECAAVCRTAIFVDSVEQSKALNAKNGPMAIISASGMLTGGRVLHHLKRLAPDPRNTIVLPGFQAPGTRGAAVAAGADAVKVHGAYVPIRAEVVALDAFSAHADQADLLGWLEKCPRPPRRVFLVHGEAVAADALRLRIQEKFAYDVDVAEHGDTVDLV